VAIGRLRLHDASGERVLVPFLRVVGRGWTTSLDEPGPAFLGRPVPPGRYRLRVLRGEQVAAEREVDVGPGRTTEVEIHLPRR
jgi:hypothetical protein